jgi:hypothetical protein
VTKHLASVKRNPVKRCVGKFVYAVPAKFLCQESAHPREPTDLRQLARVAKRVWKPESRAPLTEMAFKEALTMDELPDQRLSTRHIGVMFHPATANWMEGALFHLRFHSVKKRRVVLFKPFVLLGLRSDETMLRVAVQEVTLIRP